jgi:Inner membrane component of T3SS, periplasmic domain/Inner membrane component of T3SS, cytoplasmic domain
MESDRIFSVSVLEGSHAGATLELGAGKYRFGRSHDADVVLTDAGLAPLHFSIELAKKGASVTSMEGPVTLDGCAAAASKDSARLHFPFELAVDGVRLRVDGPEAANWGQVAFRWYDRCEDWVKKQNRTHVIAALAIVPIAIFALGATGTTGEVADASQADLSRTTTSAMPVSKAVEILQSKAVEAGLPAQLVIEPAGEAIAVRGTLAQDQMAAWQRVRQDFDAAFGNRYAFDSQITMGSAATRPLLDLQAIWSGSPPYVITMSGERLGEGDRLISGWTIETIESRRVVLSQGDQRVTLTY